MTRSKFLKLATEVYDEIKPTTKAEFKEAIQAIFDELCEQEVEGIESEGSVDDEDEDEDEDVDD